MCASTLAAGVVPSLIDPISKESVTTLKVLSRRRTVPRLPSWRRSIRRRTAAWPRELGRADGTVSTLGSTRERTALAVKPGSQSATVHLFRDPNRDASDSPDVTRTADGSGGARMVLRCSVPDEHERN
jgi:hypothetical protein